MKMLARSTTRLTRGTRALAVSVLLSISFIGSVSAGQAELNARDAITRAEAKIDLVSKENPAATQNTSFVNAQQKLVAAKAAIVRNNDQQAMWLATEAELFAENTAGASKLAGLERTRSEVARDVDILESELRKE